VSNHPDNGRPAKVPRHVAIVMDGNGRWAQARGLSRPEGHQAGTENIRPILKAAVELGIEVLTIYAFSTENWRRPQSEVEFLFSLIGEVIRRETDELNRNGVRVRHIGFTDNIPPDLAASIAEAVDLTAHNDRIILNVAFNYGGRAEIVHAIKRAVRDGVDPEAIDEATLDRYMTTAGQPDPDLIVRTGGEMRLSNFLIWQAAYAEYYSTPTYWPDFGRDDLVAAVEAYGQRQRRFGRVTAS
jgi:undecaprenyl diphosphate synthase